MNRTLTDVLVERERLRARCDQQRRDVSIACRGLAAPAAVVDRLVAGGRYLVQHPVAVLGLMGAAFALRGRRMLNLAVRGIGLWRLARKVQSIIRLVQR